MRKFLIIIAIILLIYLGLVIFGPNGLALIGVSVNDAKTMTDALRSFTETVAIVVAGIWTYERFIKAKEETRENYPYPKIVQRCEHHRLENNIVYLSVFVTVTNQGKTKLDLDGAYIYIRQVSPLSDEIKERLKEALQNSSEEDIRRGRVEALFVDKGQRLGWVTLGYRDWKAHHGKINELEPGQTREFQFDFLLLEDDVDVIEAISYIENGESAWELGTLYSLNTQKEQTVF